MRRVVAVLAVAAGLALAGCAAPSPDGPPATAVPENAAPVEFTMADFCAGVSAVASAVFNADVGFLHHGVSEGEWRTRIEQARTTADLLVAAAPAGDLRSAAERLRVALVDAVRPPTDAGFPENYERIQPIFVQINRGAGGCVDNGTEAPIMGEFGG